MKKNTVLILIGIICVSLFAANTAHAQDIQANYIAIFPMTGEGLGDTPDVVRSKIAENFTRYAQGKLSVLSWDSIEAILRQAADAGQDGGGAKYDAAVMQFTNAQYVLQGKIRKSGKNYNVSITITDKKSNNRQTAAYSQNHTLDELNNLSAANKASAELLKRMGVTLSAQDLAQLTGAASTNQVDAYAALAQAAAAGRQGNDVQTLWYAYQAQSYDSSLVEAMGRVQAASVAVSSGDMGQNFRNNIARMDAWKARLAETEKTVNDYIKNLKFPVALLYTPNYTRVKDDYSNKSVDYTFENIEMMEMSKAWIAPIEKTIQAVRNGLTATGMAKEWGMDGWPGAGWQNVFRDKTTYYKIAVEFVNKNKKVAAKQTFTVEASCSFGTNPIKITTSISGKRSLTFTVKADDDYEPYTIRFTTVNDIPVNTAGKQGLLYITTREGYRDANGYDLQGYDKDGYARNGYNRSGYNKEGYDWYGFNKVGYDRAGYDRTGFNKEGYDREGFDRGGFNKEGYNRVGFDRRGFNKEGYDREDYDRNGFNKAGYNRDGFNKDGYDRDGYNKTGDSLHDEADRNEIAKDSEFLLEKEWKSEYDSLSFDSSGNFSISGSTIGSYQYSPSRLYFGLKVYEIDSGYLPPNTYWKGKIINKRKLQITNGTATYTFLSK